jgi:uncharacterized membrane protein
MKAATLLAVLLIAGCLGSSQSIKLNIEVEPNKVALEEPEPISIKVNAINIGPSRETISAGVTETQGLKVIEPNKTVFTLKNGESRTIVFTALLTTDAVPGDYIIDVQVKTESGEIVQDRAKITVVQKKGLL